MLRALSLLLDELDVADLESEEAHGYVLGPASSEHNVVETHDGLVDGGRRQRSRESFRLRGEQGGSIVLRYSATAAAVGRLSVAGQPLADVTLDGADFREVTLEVGQLDGVRDVLIEWNQPVTVLHYWSFARVL